MKKKLCQQKASPSSGPPNDRHHPNRGSVWARTYHYGHRHHPSQPKCRRVVRAPTHTRSSSNGPDATTRRRGARAREDRISA